MSPGKKIKTPDSLKMQLKRLATDNRIYRITVIKNQYNSLFLVPNKQKNCFTTSRQKQEDCVSFDFHTKWLT